MSRSLAGTVDKGQGTPVVLADHAPFAWDRVCVLGPYTADARVDSITGIRGAFRRAHGIHSRDAINVLMFVDDDRIVASIAHPRSQGDFGPELQGQCYSREGARFVVQTPPMIGRE